MKCPHCNKKITMPIGQRVLASGAGVNVIVLYSPSCDAVLGAVNELKRQ